jgi:hypothetical protein
MIPLLKKNSKPDDTKLKFDLNNLEGIQIVYFFLLNKFFCKTNFFLENQNQALDEKNKNDQQPNNQFTSIKKHKKTGGSLRQSLRRRSVSYGKHVISTKDIRTAFMLFVVSFLFIIFYLPSLAATYMSMFIPNMPVNLYITYLYFSNSAINPIIYCFLNPNFRNDLIKLFFKRGFIFEKCSKNVM